MKLDWVNEGREFVPKTMLGEAEDYLTFVEETTAGPGAMKRVWSKQLDLLAAVLHRTDASVTREKVGQNVPLSDAPVLVTLLLQEPLVAHERIEKEEQAGA